MLKDQFYSKSGFDDVLADMKESANLVELTYIDTYIAFSFPIGAIVYPVASSWAWSGDWQYENEDFVGPGGVHELGGFVGAMILGLCIGFFDEDETTNNVRHKASAKELVGEHCGISDQRPHWPLEMHSYQNSWPHTSPIYSSSFEEFQIQTVGVSAWMPWTMVICFFFSMLTQINIRFTENYFNGINADIIAHDSIHVERDPTFFGTQTTSKTGKNLIE